MKTAIELVVEERARQISVEGWTAEHDEKHDNSQLAYAASAYAGPVWLADFAVNVDLPIQWPFSNAWWKPCRDNRIKELVKAGALIVAEIERLQRKEARALDEIVRESEKLRLYNQP